jgi:hypothetical protein
MVTGGDVLSMLCPDSKWTIYGDDFNSINWHGDVAPITEAEFKEGFAKVSNWQEKELVKKNTKKRALLEKLGITEEEAALLLG